MKVLVTGGTGVIGAGVIPELLRHGHSVRLLSCQADEESKRWRRADMVSGDVADPASMRGAAGGCDAIIHIAGITAETPPDQTFERVNIGGTRNVVAEAERGGVRRLLFVSSLGADRLSTDHHRSKAAAERIVARSNLEWIIVRPGSVYGPGDGKISTVLKLVRALPAIPMTGDGVQTFQPIWFEDLGRAIVTLLERTGSKGHTYELAGSETTSLRDLLRRFAVITGRKPPRIPVPMSLAPLASKIASHMAHVPMEQLTMLHEETVLADPNARPLAELGVEETPLDRGLRILADSIPEQLPEDGVGAMEHKKFWADITGSSYSAPALMTIFRDRVTEMMPIDFAAEPGSPIRIEQGITMTASLPLRGNIQIRVERVDPTRVTFATIEGHPIAGIVEFATRDLPQSAVQFAVEVFARAGNVFDFVALRTLGDHAQSANWRTVVQRMIEASGGTSDGVQHEVRNVEEDEAAKVEKEVRSMVQERNRQKVRS